MRPIAKFLLYGKFQENCKVGSPNIVCRQNCSLKIVSLIFYYFTVRVGKPILEPLCFGTIMKCL